jgi:guanosine-3',5'-bis(diphosphate) 3'-pyrophosphohydrolase
MNDLITKAQEFGYSKHFHQRYGDSLNYSKHLNDVYCVLLEFGFNGIDHSELLASAFLHDTIEDTATSYNDIKKEFGYKIAEICFAVTDELGRNRKERHEKTYIKLKQLLPAIVLKVADRIANVRFSISQGSSQLEMYRKEFADFKKHLKIDGHIVEMWGELENLLK